MHIHFATAALGPSSSRTCLTTTRLLPPPGCVCSQPRSSRGVPSVLLPAQLTRKSNSGVPALQASPDPAQAPCLPRLFSSSMGSTPTWPVVSLGVGPRSSDTSTSRQSSAQRRGPPITYGSYSHLGFGPLSLVLAPRRDLVSLRLSGHKRVPPLWCTGFVCVEKSLSISALIANIDDLTSSTFHRLDVAISTI